MIAIIWLASWGLAIYICHSLAKKKGMDTTSAIVWSVIFGWFAVIYYALKEPHDSAAKQKITNQTPKDEGNVMRQGEEKKMAPKQRNLLLIGAVVIVLLSLIHWYTTQNVGSIGQSVDNIYLQVASDAVRQYEIAKRNGSKMDACVHAGIVAAAYLQVKDEMSYQQWKRIESIDCSAAGIPLLGN